MKTMMLPTFLTFTVILAFHTSGCGEDDISSLSLEEFSEMDEGAADSWGNEILQGYLFCQAPNGFAPRCPNSGRASLFTNPMAWSSREVNLSDFHVILGSYTQIRDYNHPLYSGSIYSINYMVFAQLTPRRQETADSEIEGMYILGAYRALGSDAPTPTDWLVQTEDTDDIGGFLETSFDVRPDAYFRVIAGDDGQLPKIYDTSDGIHFNSLGRCLEGFVFPYFSDDLLLGQITQDDGTTMELHLYRINFRHHIDE